VLPSHKGMDASGLTAISHEEGVGRVLVATQDIASGQCVLEDQCVVATPDGFPACLGCLSLVQAGTHCLSCKWPSCGSSTCSHQASNAAECHLYQEQGVAPTVQNPSQPHSMYALVAVVRLLLLKQADPQQYKVVEDLMDHWEERSEDLAVRQMVKYMAAFCRKKFGLTWVTDQDVQHAFGVLKTNGVGHTSPDGSKVCFLYPQVSLLSHSCAANLEIVDRPAETVKFVAKRPIKMGEELTWR